MRRLRIWRIRKMEIAAKPFGNNPCRICSPEQAICAILRFKCHLFVQKTSGGDRRAVRWAFGRRNIVVAPARRRFFERELGRRLVRERMDGNQAAHGSFAGAGKRGDGKRAGQNRKNGAGSLVRFCRRAGRAAKIGDHQRSCLDGHGSQLQR